ncbi:hypothetical protein EDD11_005422 [Mortierella claussenii]|nr:hypothetical protein EDD11_005422 [Mortierella claussenii]
MASSTPTAPIAQICENGVVKQASTLKLDSSDKLFFAPTDRNKDVILDQLRPLLAQSQYVLEVGSGSGQHIFHFSKAFPKVIFQPTEYDTALFASIEAYTADLDPSHRDQVRKPLELDTTKPQHWQNILQVGGQELQLADDAQLGKKNEGGVYDLVIAINIFHITSWDVGSSIIRGAGLTLRTGGYFVTYGAFKKDGKFSSESNEQFDQALRSRDPSWGVRDIEALQEAAEKESHLRLVKIENMPSNNYLLVFQKLALEQ